jgi:hypothetical protein
MQKSNNDNQSKEFRFGDSYEGESIVTVWCDGRAYDPRDELYRPVYCYSIQTSTWKYDANDIHGAPNEIPNLTKASQSLFAFLLACVESSEGGENYALFPPEVRQWADHFSEEIQDQYLQLNR